MITIYSKTPWDTAPWHTIFADTLFWFRDKNFQDTLFFKFFNNFKVHYSDAILIEPGDSLGSIGVVTKSKDFGFDSS